MQGTHRRSGEGGERACYVTSDLNYDDIEGREKQKKGPDSKWNGDKYTLTRNALGMQNSMIPYRIPCLEYGKPLVQNITSIVRSILYEHESPRPELSTIINGHRQSAINNPSTRFINVPPQNAEGALLSPTNNLKKKFKKKLLTRVTFRLFSKYYPLTALRSPQLSDIRQERRR